MTILHFPQRPRPGWTDQPQHHKITRHGKIEPLDPEGPFARAVRHVRRSQRRISTGQRFFRALERALWLFIAIALAASTAVHIGGVIG